MRKMLVECSGRQLSSRWINTSILRAAEEGGLAKHPGAGCDSSPQFRGWTRAPLLVRYSVLVPKSRQNSDQSHSCPFSEYTAGRLVKGLRSRNYHSSTHNSWDIFREKYYENEFNRAIGWLLSLWVLFFGGSPFLGVFASPVFYSQNGPTFVPGS
jgi:hypothetical protein